jgi:hypothetical protein
MICSIVEFFISMINVYYKYHTFPKQIHMQSICNLIIQIFSRIFCEILYCYNFFELKRKEIHINYKVY